jgi:hypothetical protein
MNIYLIVWIDTNWGYFYRRIGTSISLMSLDYWVRQKLKLMIKRELISIWLFESTQIGGIFIEELAHLYLCWVPIE